MAKGVDLSVFVLKLLKRKNNIIREKSKHFDQSGTCSIDFNAIQIEK